MAGGTQHERACGVTVAGHGREDRFIVVTPTPRSHSPQLTRRSFVVGAGTLGVLAVAGCGSGTTTSAAPSTSNSDTLNLALRFDPNSYALAGVPQRLVTSVVTNRNEPPDDLTGSLEFQLTRDGQPVGDPITTEAHADGVPIAYFPVRTTIAEPGTYSLTTTVAGATLAAPLIVSPSAGSALVQPGQALPAVATPTLDDARSIDPICTRKPEICPFHAVDLTTALATGSATALLVSTPQFCQIGVCGPVLNLLMEYQGRYPGITFVHAEVFTGLEGPDGPTAPTVAAMGLEFEPSLFLVGADGVVTDRLDIVFDRAEITTGLDALVA